MQTGQPSATEPVEASPRTRHLSDLLPVYETRMREVISIARPPADVYAALTELRMSDMRLATMLNVIRAAPLIVPDFIDRPRGNMPRKLRVEHPFLEQMTISGPLIPLVDVPGHELIGGLVGKVWMRDFGFRSLRGPQEFIAFDEPGYVKIAIDYRAEEAPGGAVLISETRVHATSDDAARKFRWYWLMVCAGAYLTVRSMLKAVKQRAEGAPM